MDRRTLTFIGLGTLALLAVVISVALMSGANLASGSGSGPTPAVSGVVSIPAGSGAHDALVALGASVQKDPALNVKAAAAARAIGAARYAQLQDLSKTFAECEDAFFGGCYVGALSAYLAGKPATAQLGNLACASVAAPAPGRFACLQGVGEALFALTGSPLEETLSLCDGLIDAEREPCGAGVYLGNLNAFFQYRLERGLAPTDRDRTIPANVHFDPSDHQIPCRSAPAVYPGVCYEILSWAIMFFNDGSPSGAFADCDAAPAAVISRCYFALGRLVYGPARADGAIVTFCPSGRAALREWCYFGALSFLAETLPRAQALCAATPLGERSACAGGLGRMLARFFVGDAPLRERECAKLEAPFAGVCAAAAAPPPLQ